MWRPVDGEMPEVFESDGDGAAALIEAGVQVDTQAGDGGPFQHVRGAVREAIQMLLRRRSTGEKLAFRPLQLQLENQLVLALPAILRQQRRAGVQICER